MTKCIYCKDKNIVKNGVLKNGGQRFRCRLCLKSFTIGGKRGTYDESFKEKIMVSYCHKNTSARNIILKYKISSATLISWSKKHKKNCADCC